MEMNTRLQVEHPVTEMITGVDLVKEQIRVARGEEISFKQEDLKIHGHSIEVRVYAENARENFMPDIGNLRVYKRPHGVGVRVDDGFEEGMDIPIYYDPMISKLVTYGKDREEARLRMIRAIEDYKIVGLSTTMEFARFVMEHESFISGDFDTHFVKKHFSPELLDAQEKNDEDVASTIVAKLVADANKKAEVLENGSSTRSNWKIKRT